MSRFDEQTEYNRFFLPYYQKLINQMEYPNEKEELTSEEFDLLVKEQDEVIAMWWEYVSYNFIFSLFPWNIRMCIRTFIDALKNVDLNISTIDQTLLEEYLNKEEELLSFADYRSTSLLLMFDDSDSDTPILDIPVLKRQNAECNGNKSDSD